MSPVLVIATLLVLLFMSALFSGCETGVYSLSRIRLEAEVGGGSRSARILARLLRNDTALLIMLLVGTNLMLELLTHVFEGGVLAHTGLPEWSREIIVTVVLAPIVFLLGELLPKDAFRRRPHFLLGLATPLLVVMRLLLLPITFPLLVLSLGLERLFGLRSQEFARALGREEVLEILQEGTRAGALEPHAEELARNVLILRETTLADLLLPWSEVRTIDLDLPPDEARREAVEAEFTRLPALQSSADDGTRRVVGYIHQLDVLGNEEADVRTLVRPIPVLAAGVSLDAALARLRISGQRLALVGSAEEPAGLVTLMDLVDAVAGERRPGRRP